MKKVGNKTVRKPLTFARAASLWTLPAALAFVFVALVIAGAAVSPYLFQATTLEREIALQLRATTGLSLSSPTTGRFELLPRPHVVLDALHVADPTGALVVDADGLDGDVRLVPLLVGRVELSSATLIRPRFTIDLAGRPVTPESLIGLAIRASGPVVPGDRQRLGTLTTVGGRADIKGAPIEKLKHLSAIDLTLDWRDLDSPATLTGSLIVDHTPFDLAAWAAQPAKLLGGDHSAMALHVHSDPIDISANGDLARGATTSFRGHLSGRAPSVPAILDLLDRDTPLLAPFADLAINGDIGLAVDARDQASIDLSSLKVRVDGNEYEGTLAFQGAPPATLSGTLATELLTLKPFLFRVPALQDAKNAWSDTPLIGRTPPHVDLDLRISATHVRLSPLTIDDAAIAIITRGDRTEVALVDGKAYGGTAKGRFSVGTHEGIVALRASGTLSDVDAATMSWDAFGRQIAAGTLNASMNVEASGANAAALAHGLQGWAKGSIRDGELSGVDLASGRAPPPAATRNGRTAFNKFSLGVRIADGLATIEDGSMAGSATATFSGEVDLGNRTLDVHCTAAQPGAPKHTNLVFDIEGPFDGPRLIPTIAGQRPGAATQGSPERSKAAPR